MGSWTGVIRYGLRARVSTRMHSAALADRDELPSASSYTTRTTNTQSRLLHSSTYARISSVISVWIKCLRSSGHSDLSRRCTSRGGSYSACLVDIRLGSKLSFGFSVVLLSVPICVECHYLSFRRRQAYVKLVRELSEKPVCGTIPRTFCRKRQQAACRAK